MYLGSVKDEGHQCLVEVLVVEVELIMLILIYCVLIVQILRLKEVMKKCAWDNGK